MDHYRRADLFVLPSFAEGVPVVLMEAMAQEIPVISTRITGIPELIEHEKTGLLVTPGNAGELAEATTEHPELIQYYCTDWDFILSRADSNGFWILAGQEGIALVFGGWQMGYLVGAQVKGSDGDRLVFHDFEESVEVRDLHLLELVEDFLTLRPVRCDNQRAEDGNPLFVEEHVGDYLEVRRMVRDIEFIITC